MSLPKAKVEEVKYDEWAGEVAIDGYNDGKYGRSFICKIDGEDIWINPGKKLPIKLEKGNVYSIKMGRKVGTKGWYVNDATLIGGTARIEHVIETAENNISVCSKKELTDTKPVEINGQAKGNYRTGLMAFICTHYQIKGEFPDPDLLTEFNALIKSGEDSFWNGKFDIIETTPPSDTKGLIE